MIVALGTDHGGFSLKKAVVETIVSSNNEVLDLGTFDETPVDYPDYAQSVARALADKQARRGILLCGSGVGACIAANKVAGIRACLCHDTYSAHQGVEHDDMNILCLGARVIGPELAAELIRSFLGADFSGKARHRRRLEKILVLENSFRPE
jgi:RpiB/LacA/LacB family sugar-phosphate isomerase